MTTPIPNYLILETESIQKAISSMNQSRKRIAVVVNEDLFLVGVVTDSDIRRSMLNNVPLDENVKRIMVRNPIIGYAWNTQKEILHLMKIHDIYQVPVVNEENRVVSLVTINDLLSLKRPRLDNPVVLMAGGMGTRLYPLTKDIPKPLVPINGKSILSIIIDNLIESGFSDLSVSVNYKGEMIREELQRDIRYRKIQIIEESIRLGTAGALSLLTRSFDDPVLIQNADILTTIDYYSMIKFHNEHDFQMTIAVRREKVQIPYGVVSLEGLNVTAIKEKPEHLYFANVGIYVISPEVLSRIPYNQYYDMTTLVEACIRDKVRVGSFPVHEYWTDIGRMDDLEEARNGFSENFNQ